jgi:hypothetical protein
VHPAGNCPEVHPEDVPPRRALSPQLTTAPAGCVWSVSVQCHALTNPIARKNNANKYSFFILLLPHHFKKLRKNNQNI